MKLASLGTVKIEAIPKADNPEIMTVIVRSSNRTESITGVTNNDENTDQFAKRIRGMLTALLQSEVKMEKPEGERGPGRPKKEVNV